MKEMNTLIYNMDGLIMKIIEILDVLIADECAIDFEHWLGKGEVDE